MEVSGIRRHRVPIISRERVMAAAKKQEGLFRDDLKEINELEKKVQFENDKPWAKEEGLVNKKRRVMIAIKSMEQLYNDALPRQQQPPTEVSLDDMFLAVSSAKHAAYSASKSIDKLSDALTVFRKTLTCMKAVRDVAQIYSKPATLPGYSDGADVDVDEAPSGR